MKSTEVDAPSSARPAARRRGWRGTVEWLLWQSRLLMIVAVAASAIAAVAALYLASVDVVVLLGMVAGYTDPGLSTSARLDLRAEIITGLVKAIDGYLLAAIMLIFSLGLYELFIDRLEPAEGSDLASRLLLIRSLDDLKDRLAKVVVLILVVKFFQMALKLKFESPLDLLYLGLAILFVGGAIYLSGRKGTHA
ncbi:MAG: YqhA family protein [Chloroflexota bacterium]